MATARKTSARGVKGSKKKTTAAKKAAGQKKTAAKKAAGQKKTAGAKKTAAKRAAATRGRAPAADPGTPQGGPRPWATESGEPTLAGQDLTPESGRWPYRGQAQEEQERS